MLPHGANPDHSALEVMTQAQYNVSSDSNVQNLLCHKNIVITNHPVPKLSFDEDGLEVLNMTMEAVTLYGVWHHIWLTRIYLKTSWLMQWKITSAMSKAPCRNSWILPGLFHLAGQKSSRLWVIFLWYFKFMSKSCYNYRMMQSNTHHIIFTLEHVICIGGHFYTTSTLQNMLYDLEQHFFLGHLVTTAEYITSHLLLCRFAHFFPRRLTRPGTYQENGLSCLECDECALAEVFTLPHIFWSARALFWSMLITVGFPLSPARLAGKGLSDGPLRSVQHWSECSALVSVLSAESLSDAEQNWVSHQKSRVMGSLLLKKKLQPQGLNSGPLGRSPHGQKFAISTCTMLHFIARGN